MWPEFAFKCSSPKLHFLKQGNVDFAELWLQIGSQCIRGHMVSIGLFLLADIGNQKLLANKTHGCVK